MNLHYFQHVPFEGPGRIENWASANKHALTSTNWYLDERPPLHSDIDWLIIMGGPMSIHDTAEYPWLRAEKDYILQAVRERKTVLGICLGAQLIADVLGGNITANKFREIGWFPVARAPDLQNRRLCDSIPEEMEAFHWHGETFTLPPGSERIAGTPACRNQGFVFKDRVIALQFHLEVSIESAAELIKNCHDEIKEEKFIQPAEEMLSNPERFQRSNRNMDAILDYLEAVSI